MSEQNLQSSAKELKELQRMNYSSSSTYSIMSPGWQLRSWHNVEIFSQDTGS